jgi:hypothetical protein
MGATIRLQTLVSIDLLFESVRPLSVRPLLPKIAAVLAEILGLPTPPPLSMASFENGLVMPATVDKVGVLDTPLFLISIIGEPETVQLVGRSDNLAMSISGARSDLVYALGAAVAITLAREFGAGLWDDSKFFGDRRLHVTRGYAGALESNRTTR